MVFLFNLYYKLKKGFLSPKFQGSLYGNLEQTIGHNEDKFTWWDFNVLNMSAISKGLFRTPVENQLGLPKSRQTFPYIAKRYVFTRIFTSIKGNPEIVGAVAQQVLLLVFFIRNIRIANVIEK